MRIGIIGLGRMGGNMARRLARGGHEVVAFNRSSERAVALAREEKGITAVLSLAELADKLSPPRTVWMMLTEGNPTEEALQSLFSVLSKGDTVIDGGNSNFQDTLRRACACTEKGIHLVDVGTSGGIWGLEKGYSMTVGGAEGAVERLRPLFETLAPAPDRGWGYVGPNGAGHFVKMIHNGIEYGLLQAYAEGFDILRSGTDFCLDIARIARTWGDGSVVRSWILDLAASVLSRDADLGSVRGWVADSGEGRWTVFEAINRNVPCPVITLSLISRLASRRDESYANKLIAAVRGEFGGHEIPQL